MRIMFLISSFLLIYMFMCIKKYNKKENVLKWIVISLVLFMCLNALEIFVLSILHIKSYLVIRSIINLLIGTILYFKYIRNKSKQEYYFEIRDLLIIVLLIISSIIIYRLQFGKDGVINFATTDPAVHYLNAKVFYENNSIPDFLDLTTIYGKTSNEHSMFFGHVNLGTTMQLLDVFLKDNLYKAFLLFETIMLSICGMLFYFTIKREQATKIDWIMSVILTMLYLFGYPLNNTIFGFHYLGLGVILINLSLLLYTQKKECVTYNLYIVLLTIVNFMVFCCYFLFVPALYAGVGFYLIYLWFKNKKDFRKLLFEFIVTLVIPFIIGFVYYFILPRFSDVPSVNPIRMEGFIYRNLMANFVVLIPCVIYVFYKEIKEKELDVVSFNFVIFALATFIFFIGISVVGVSTYYFYKFYFVMWLAMFLMLGKGLKYKDNFVLKIYVISYVVICLLAITNIEYKIKDRNYLVSPFPVTNSLADIYMYNKNFLLQDSSILSKDEMQLLKYVRDNKDKLLNSDDEIVIIGDVLQKLWAYSLYDVVAINDYSYLAQYYEDNISLNDIEKNDEIKYFVVFYSEKWYQENNKELSKYNVIYQNESGVILAK